MSSPTTLASRRSFSGAGGIDSILPESSRRDDGGKLSACDGGSRKACSTAPSPQPTSSTCRGQQSQSTRTLHFQRKGGRTYGFDRLLRRLELERRPAERASCEPQRRIERVHWRTGRAARLFGGEIKNSKGMSHCAGRQLAESRTLKLNGRFAEDANSRLGFFRARRSRYDSSAGLNQRAGEAVWQREIMQDPQQQKS